MTERLEVTSEHLAADEAFGPCALPGCPNNTGGLAAIADPDDSPAGYVCAGTADESQQQTDGVGHDPFDLR